jgi:hypothetical protein
VQRHSRVLHIPPMRANHVGHRGGEQATLDE